ncbi:MAG: NADH ubiquinone oxidoreductase chain C [Candidatus Syntrophoarchaeum sp. GoM_oil]|nr:MAG: NADH ubiquinone oxidoreductase chain C [Candidatus Syntrophoarchaeum sp. GoM_oil]
MIEELLNTFPDAVKSEDNLILVKAEHIVDVCSHIKKKGFDFLEAISGADFEDHIEVIYNIASYEKPDRITLTVKISNDNPILPSVNSVWSGANWHEREAYDMFGIKFTGHPNLSRILLPDSWEGYPLLKSYPLDKEQEVKLEDETGVEICQI